MISETGPMALASSAEGSRVMKRICHASHALFGAFGATDESSLLHAFHRSFTLPKTHKLDRVQNLKAGQALTKPPRCVIPSVWQIQ